jgi:acetyl-CoA carboxylase biotin carboxyl carrier protein
MATINVLSVITGIVWKVLVKPGDQVSEDDSLLILESMKMEIPVTSPEDGVVKEVCVIEGALVAEGDVTLILEV